MTVHKNLTKSTLKYVDIYILMLIYFMAYFRYGGNAKVVHFLGKTKPWSYTFDPKAKQITGSVEKATTHPTFLLDWWSLYSSAVVPMLQEQYGDKPFHSGCVEVSEHICLIGPAASKNTPDHSNSFQGVT